MAKPNWITVNPSSGTGAGIFKITLAQNTSTSARSGIVTVKSLSGLTHEIQITQEGKSSRGKITFNCTGNEIPQKYVGYILYVAESEISPEFYAEYGQIESITADTVVVNLDNVNDLESILGTINGDMTGLMELYFGISSSDDPTIDWVPLLLADDPDDKDYVSQLVATKIQYAFNGLNDVILCKSLIASSAGDIKCSWGLSAVNLLLASVTQKTLDQSSSSEINFKVYADIYPDGQRLNDSSMINIEVGQFTLGAMSGQNLNEPVLVRTSTNSQFTWYKEYSTVALCRFTIKCNYGDINSTLSKSLIINDKIFTKHEVSGVIYFENLEGIPLQYTTASQSLNISSNYPTLTFNMFA